MKIAITASSNDGLETNIEPRFGRAPYFAIIDPDTMGIEFIKNTAAQAAGGAGIQAAQIIADQKVDGLISGNFGPKAFSGLNAANIKLYSFTGGSLREAVEAFKGGKLTDISNPTNDTHFGMK